MVGEVHKVIKQIYSYFSWYRRYYTLGRILHSRKQYENFGNNGWIPNLHPEYDEQLVNKLFDLHFANPAYERWGCKVITWGPDMVNKVYSTFPDAQFVFVHRNLKDVEKSAKITSWWQDMPISKWAYKHSNFMEYFKHLPKEMNYLILDYDAFSKNLQELPETLENALGITDIDRDIVNHKIGDSVSQGGV